MMFQHHLTCLWRYLGFFLTPTLNWSMHVTRCANKAKAIAGALRIIANCIRGLTILDSRTIFMGLV
jgi:hypothetical protein